MHFSGKLLIMNKDTIYTIYKENFLEEPLISAAPGRVNIIGEHTDYNQGFVLPGAIDKKIYFAIAKNNTQNINLLAADFNKTYTLNANKLLTHPNHWSNYFIGVIEEIRKIHPFDLKGFNCVFGGNLPTGAGLSSSAALETGFAVAINEIFSIGLSKSETIEICQKAEHNYVGTKCGIMDQFAVMMGKKDHVMQLDCKTLDYEYFPLNSIDYKFVLINSKIQHSLASSEYNIRRAECERGVEILKEHYPAVTSLRDATTEMLKKHEDKLPHSIYKRCKYVINENQRVVRFCKLLKLKELEVAGNILFEGHDGLSRRYEVSCPEIDFLVEHAKTKDYVKGSRMMGGGFGGCTINIIEKNSFEEFQYDFSKIYSEKFNILPDFHEFTLEDGAQVL